MTFARAERQQSRRPASSGAPPPAPARRPGTRPLAQRLATFTVGGRIPPPGDRIHGPVLDEYSRETGAPRDDVTQHDPGYEAWLLGRPVVPPAINITVNLPVPRIPPPDYSRDQARLGAWERANFVFQLRSSFACDHRMAGTVEESFVTDVGVEIVQGAFELFIASHIHDNMTDMGREIGERNTWSRIHSRIRVHASEHFVRYRQTVAAMEQTITARLAALPTRNSPIRIPQADLEAYVGGLLQHLVGRLRHALWRTTCDWEHADYPTLLRGIPSVGGRFVPNCDPEPVVPPEPPLPIVVTPGAPPRAPGRSRRP